MERDNRKVNRDRRLNLFFLGFLTVPTLIWLFICLIGLVFPGVMKSIDYDTGENRNKTEFPSQWSGDYFARLESFYDDRVPFRSLIMSGGAAASDMFEKPYRNGIKNDLIALIYGEEPQASEPETTRDFSGIFDSQTSEEADNLPVESRSVEAATTTQAQSIDTTSYLPPEVRNDNVIIGRGDWLFLFSYSNIYYYLGSNVLTDEEMAVYANAVTACNNACMAKGKKLSIMFVPDKTQVYSEYMPNYEIVDSYKRVPRLTDYLKANTAARVSYPIEEMLAIKQYYRPYLKYDTHWNSVGAFIGCQVLNRSLGREATNLLNLSVIAEPLAGGDLIGFGNLNAADYTNDLKYTISVPNEALATIVTGGVTSDKDVYHVELDIPGGEAMVMIGDSYRNAMAEFIYHGYRSSTVIHVNFLANSGGTLDKYLLDADDICIVLGERNDYRLLETLDYITNLLQ